MSSLIGGILASQAPVKQTVNATISTLCDRLQHATLLEDRRAAVQGLRSFAREYKETVASEGLRPLISTLAKDIEDIDTVKVVLETLLLLFVKDELNPDSSDDIALWLTDEFTQKQNNISLLIDLLDKTDFYARLYALQLLVAILKNRPDRTRECIFSAPLGISRLVSVLDDKRDIIRNEGIMLLTALTENHSDIQKLVAFENAFERIFDIIKMEGGIDGGVAVRDCLLLLSSLLSFNVSNQSFFRETSCVPRLASLFNIDGEAPGYAKDVRIGNICLSLSICRLFVVPDGTGTRGNQVAFWKNGITLKVLNLAFAPTTDHEVRAEALSTVADLIRGNGILQENFPVLQVEALNFPPQTSQDPKGIFKVYVIEGLLDLALLGSSNVPFSTRLAASDCINGYYDENPAIRVHFLTRAIDGFSSGTDETANIMNALMELDSDSRADPYRTWLSSSIFLQLVHEDSEAKAVAMALSTGDAESGEEVVTAIQTFTANLISSIQYKLDSRISIAFLMSLCIWLFNEPAAVDDFLGEGSNVQSLVAIVTQSNDPDILIQGLCAFLLGIVYEFSHTESPVPRATIHSTISGISRDQYLHKLRLLRHHPSIRDFEVSEQGTPNGSTPPIVYFNATFVDFLKDNYSRIYRAIGNDPGKDDSLTNGNGSAKKLGVSAEMYESIKLQLDSKEEELSKIQTELVKLQHLSLQEHEEARRSRETSANTIKKIKEVAAQQIASARDRGEEMKEQLEADLASERELHEKLLKRVEEEKDEAIRLLGDQRNQGMNDLVAQHDMAVRGLIVQHERLLSNTRQDHKKALLHLRAQHETASKTARECHDTEVKILQGQILVAQNSLKEAQLRITQLEVDVKQLTHAKSELETKLARHQEDIVKMTMSHSSALEKAKAAAKPPTPSAADKKALEDLKEKLAEAEEKATATETERDDLMMVMGDLEEKKEKYKERLKALDGEVSEDDDNDEESEEEEDDDDVE